MGGRNTGPATAASRAKYPHSPVWRGDAASAQTGRKRAALWFPITGRVCAECEDHPARDRHHWDGDALNNTPTNVVPLCRRCHMRIDGRLASLGAYSGPRGRHRRKA